MGDDDASVMLLTCVDDPSDAGGARSGVAAGWPCSNPVAARPPCCNPGADFRAVTVPARPGRADVDPLLAGPVRRLVVAGTDADLAAVLVRLLRRDRLDVELAYIPADHRSAAARLWGLPRGPAAVELARTGVARPAPLVRDDTGGVLVGRGDPWRHRIGARRGLLRRAAGAARVGAAAGGDAPGGRGAVARRDRRARSPGLAVRASRWGALPDGRPARCHRRLVRAGSGRRAGRPGRLPARHRRPRRRGAPRPVTRWAWYRHVTDWLLVRP